MQFNTDLTAIVHYRAGCNSSREGKYYPYQNWRIFNSRNLSVRQYNPCSVSTARRVRLQKLQCCKHRNKYRGTPHKNAAGFSPTAPHELTQHQSAPTYSHIQLTSSSSILLIRDLNPHNAVHPQRPQRSRHRRLSVRTPHPANPTLTRPADSARCSPRLSRKKAATSRSTTSTE